MMNWSSGIILRVHNMDEIGMPLDPCPPKIVAPKGQKKVRYGCSGQKSHITITGCDSATGQAITPFIIFAAKTAYPSWMKCEVPGSHYTVSDYGWIDQDLFHFWLMDKFLELLDLCSYCWTATVPILS